MTLNRWLSRRRPRYIRSLVYMLQASEYDIAHFWKWHERVEDFTRVEHRKQLDFTSKALALLVAGWAALFVGCALAAYALAALPMPWGGVAFAVILLELPLFVLGGIVFSAVALRAVQAPIERLYVERARKTLASHKATKIAIAGSYGKTSMREILRTVLSEGKKVAAPPGSYNTPLGIVGFVSSLKGDEDVLVFELGEYYPGDVQKLCELVQPDIGVITGINEAHLEKFGTLEKTAETIFELADFLEEKPVYVNSENVAAREKAAVEHILYGRGGAGGWRAEEAETGLGGTSFALFNGETNIRAHSDLLGLHHIGALSAAADIASRLGLTPAHIEAGIAKTKPFAHRLELRSDAGGITTLDDSYNGNPDGVKAVIDFLAALPGRRWYVTPGLVEMGARKEEVHKEIGRQLAAAGIEKVVLIKNSVTPFIEEGLKNAGYQGEIMWFESPAIYEALPHMTVKGDIVLLQNDWPDQYS